MSLSLVEDRTIARAGAVVVQRGGDFFVLDAIGIPRPITAGSSPYRREFAVQKGSSGVKNSEDLRGAEELRHVFNLTWERYLARQRR